MALACFAAGHAFSRSPSFSEIEDMKAYIKRLKKTEQDKLHKRFEPMLQAAGVSYEVQLNVQQMHHHAHLRTHCTCALLTMNVTCCCLVPFSSTFEALT